MVQVVESFLMEDKYRFSYLVSTMAVDDLTTQEAMILTVLPQYCRFHTRDPFSYGLILIWV